MFEKYGIWEIKISDLVTLWTIKAFIDGRCVATSPEFQKKSL